MQRELWKVGPEAALHEMKYSSRVSRVYGMILHRNYYYNCKIDVVDN